MADPVKLTNSESVRVADALRRAIDRGERVRTEDLPSLFPADDDRLRRWAASRSNVLRFCRGTGLDIGRILELQPAANGFVRATDDSARLARVEMKLDAILASLGVAP
jgi:hypothetical protein